MKISYDSKSFLVDGQRRLILSGEVHYFRLPRAEWKPVLLHAKSAGLNAVCIIIPWNFHEAREGKWDFKGDHDLEAFLKLCKRMKLLVIARPGPYICAEWTFGGFPDWLHAKGIKEYRNSDPSYLALVDKYLDKILGILARNQVDRGGPVFLVQIENEFDYGPQDPAYLRHLLRKFKQKLSVPLFFGLGDTRRGGGAAPGIMLAANFLDNGQVHMDNLRRSAGNRQPLMVSEFWTGGFSGWGKPHPPKPPEMIENYITETLGAGATLINQYMFFGGTNFGDTAARQGGGDHFYCTQSYDLDAPLSEGLEINPKTRRLGLWAHRAHCLEEFLLGAETDASAPPVEPPDVALTVRAKGDSRFFFLHNPTSREIKGKVRYEVTVPFNLGPGERQYFPFNIEVTPSLVLRACTHPYLFYRLGKRLVVVAWGETGEKLSLWGTGTLKALEKPDKGLNVEQEHQGFVISTLVKDRPRKWLTQSAEGEVLFLMVNRRLAERLHFDPAGFKVVLGPQSVDFGRKRALMEPGPQTLLVATPERLKESFLKVRARPPKTLPLSMAGSFNEQALLKHVGGRKDWQAGRVGADLAEYGYRSSRAWFRLKFQAPARGKKHLVFPGVEDTFSVFSRGRHLGYYGRQGKGAQLELEVERGENELLLLVENCGRFCFGTKLGEKKGILLPVHDGGELLPYGEGWRYLAAAGPLDLKKFSNLVSVDRNCKSGSLAKILERRDHVCARKKFVVPRWAKRVRLNLHAGSINIQVAMNGRFIDRHPDFTGSGYQEIDLTPSLINGENTVALFFKGPTQGFEKSEILFLGPELPVKMEVCEGLYAPEETKILKDKAWSGGQKGKFGFWRASFKTLPSKDLSSAWLKLLHNGSGSIWFNGHSLGRHRKSGPQLEYKLPLSWLKPVNELLVFEEQAGIPQSGEVRFKFKMSEVKLP